MLDTLIKNVSIIDGTGAPGYRGSVGIKNKRITFADGTANTVIDGAGLTVMPGFIDAHSHGDLVRNDFSALSKLSQGITTEAAGQCGVSMWPFSGEETQMRFAAGICPYPELPPGNARERFSDYLDNIDKTSRLNMAVFVGHGAIRLKVMGYSPDAPDERSLNAMRQLLQEAMEGGALGLSTGLVYTPNLYASTQEITALLEPAAMMGGIYATHVRNESDTVVEAEIEALTIARRAGIPVFISHLKAAGHTNWGKTAQILELFEQERSRGLELTVDCYPYLAGMTALNVSIPPRFMQGGTDALVKRLGDRDVVETIREEIAQKSDYDNYIYNSGGFSGVMVSSCPVDRSAEGMFISDYAQKLGMDPFDAYIDILVKNRGLGLGVYFHMSEDDLLNVAGYSQSVVGTDALLGRPGDNGHPRAFGSFPRAIRHYVYEKRIFTAEEMVRRMTSMAAERLHIKNKGRIAEGYDADIILADLEDLADTATYQCSNTVAKGIKAVFVNGGKAYENGALTEGYFGRAVRRNV